MSDAVSGGVTVTVSVTGASMSSGGTGSGVMATQSSVRVVSVTGASTSGGRVFRTQSGQYQNASECARELVMPTQSGWADLRYLLHSKRKP